MRFAVVAVGRTDAGQRCCRAERGRAPACRSDAAGDKQAKQGQQAAVQRQSERAAAAQKAAQESGIDPKTRRQYEYATRKFAAWLEVHGKLLEGCGKLHRPPSPPPPAPPPPSSPPPPHPRYAGGRVGGG